MKYLFSNALICIFTKPPIPGKCKTRLIPHLGEEGAAHLQEELICKIIDDLNDYKLCSFEIWQSESSDYFTNLVLNNNFDINIKTQFGADLGERMSNTFSASLKRNKKVIIIGSDCVEYSKQYLTSALQSLDKDNAVIGPAYDGGYVLIGSTDYYPEIFKDISWGERCVLSQTLEKLSQLDITFSQLKVLNDIDTAADLKKASEFVGKSLHKL